MISDLNDRSRSIFRSIVDSYMETGEPVSSRAISRLLAGALSPATIRNVMADLEDAGLLFSPHTSAGRLPTEAGLKMFVDGLLEIGNLTHDERQSIEAQCRAKARSIDGLLQEASTLLSGLSGCAGLVAAPKTESPLKHIEFVALNPGRALVVMVTENGVVENRIIEVPAGIPSSSLVQAGNFLASRLVGRTLSEMQATIRAELTQTQAELDQLTAKVVEAGLATWSGDETPGGTLIVRGQANLLEDVHALTELEEIRGLFQALETKETVLKLVDLADKGEGVQIFIGADNKLFSLSGCSMVVGSYKNADNRIVGAIGVIGPTRMNYARIIPVVDYTSKLIGRLLG